MYGGQWVEDKMWKLGSVCVCVCVCVCVAGGLGGGGVEDRG